MTKCPKCGERIFSLTDEGEKALEELGYPPEQAQKKYISIEEVEEIIKKEKNRCRNKSSMNMYNNEDRSYIDGLNEAKELIKQKLKERR